MFLPRIIPVLTLNGKGLVKTIKFKNPRYIGDPINTVKLFNDLKADEMIFLDILASKENRTISSKIVKEIGDEAFMPFAVGGGIKSIFEIENLLKAGAEKVVLNTHALLNPELVNQASKKFGSQSIVVAIDVKKTILGRYRVYIKDGTINTGINPIEYSKKVEQEGAGEILLNSINNDGSGNGYDLGITKLVTELLSIPVIACGGAGEYSHFRTGFFDGGAHALGAGSLFVYHGPRKAVLVNYPNKEELATIFK